jgi:16S rRNA A1518/A1519 N6-dimethyltransferase RsmA/KsgA/DIM1 with predicted DNA glycosylase/AP lyase activity
MSRELNRKQQAIILSEIQRNKVLGLENPYQISSEIFRKLVEENDHETIWQNINHFIDDFKQNDKDEFYLDEWQSIKYENWRRRTN